MKASMNVVLIIPQKMALRQLIGCWVFAKALTFLGMINGNDASHMPDDARYKISGLNLALFLFKCRHELLIG